MEKHFNFDNSYLDLPDKLYSFQTPTKVNSPNIIIFNTSLAKKLELNHEKSSYKKWTRYLSGNELPKGSQPIAQSYAGHQYGNFTMLGDGRAILLGEHVTSNKIRYDIQLKGAGPTPYSRNGDGRGTLTSMLREYLISEYMNALGIPTTRSLSVISTGEYVKREKNKKGGILTRVSKGHIRIGTFQYASGQSKEILKELADYTINRFYPEISKHNNKYLEFFKVVIKRQALLVAQWQSIGFIHGVLNTDNVAIVGETIDYGPCAFMNAYDPKTVFSSIDRYGRYAYENQPKIIKWNLARFAESLLPLFHSDKKESIKLAEEALSSYDFLYSDAWQRFMRQKLGLFNKNPKDMKLVNDLLEIMAKNNLDYTNTFYELSNNEKECSIEVLQPWFERWYQRRQQQSETWTDVKLVMKYHNPYIIPRNYLVEKVLSAATNNDFKPFNDFLVALKTPYNDKNNNVTYTKPPEPKEEVRETFCGT
jgi:uncharacterized protein YdiU (UPF0061 family)